MKRYSYVHSCGAPGAPGVGVTLHVYILRLSSSDKGRCEGRKDVDDRRRDRRSGVRGIVDPHLQYPLSDEMW